MTGKFWICPFLAACAFACLPAPAATEVTIDIQPEVVKRGLDPYDYCCANWIWTSHTHALRRIFASPAQYREFIRFLRDDVSIRTIRYPAGGNVQYIHFGIPASRFIEQMRKTDPPTREDDWITLEEFFPFLADGGLRTFLQVNTLSWFDDTTGTMRSFIPPGTKLPMAKDAVNREGLRKAADRVEAMARWVKAKGYDRLIRIWELGNEEYGGFSGEAYGLIAGELARRIKLVLPDARIVVTNQLGFTRDEWKAVHQEFSAGVLKQLTEEKLTQQIAGVTNHVYAFAVTTPDGNLVNSTAYNEFASYTSFRPDDPYRHPWERLLDRKGEPASLVRKQADDLDAAGFPHADIFVTEYRLGGMQELYNQSLAGGIGNLQCTAGWVAAPHVGGSTIHSLLHASAATRGNAETGGKPRPFGIWGYDIINYQMDDNAKPQFVSTPVAEAFNLIWKLARGDVLASIASNSLLFTVATRQNNVLRLLVINRAARPERPSDVTSEGWGWGAGKELAKASEPADRFDAVIRLPKDFEPAAAASVSTLGETGKLSDRSVDPDTFNVHEIKVQTKPVVKITDRQLRYPIMPHSAVLFEIEQKGP